MFQRLNLELIFSQPKILVECKFISTATSGGFEGADIGEYFVVGLENGVFETCTF